MSEQTKAAAVAMIMRGVDQMVLQHEQVVRDAPRGSDAAAVSRDALKLLQRLQATLSREAAKVAATADSGT